MARPIYLDSIATTAVDARVLKAMLPYFTEDFGNPSSSEHSYGWVAKAAVENAREKISAFLKCEPNEILFTSGATESNQLALLGIMRAYQPGEAELIVSSVEHSSVREAATALEKEGYGVHFLKVDRFGVIDLTDLRSKISAKTKLVSVIAANNEVGTIQPLEEISTICKERSVFFHSDAAQALGTGKINVSQIPFSLLTISAHKIYGPKGVGALYVRRKNPRVTLQPLFFGGGQERDLRPGTLNVPGIVGFGEAVELLSNEKNTVGERNRFLRHKLLEGLEKNGGIEVIGHPVERLSHHLSVSISGVKSGELISSVKTVAFSTGSACFSERQDADRLVLKAMGISKEQIQSTVRFGLGRFTTEAEIEKAIGDVSRQIQALRQHSKTESGMLK